MADRKLNWKAYDGVREECGGAVNRVEPYVHLTLNGEGWC